METKNSDAQAGQGPDLDLFGKPVLPIRDRRGRPSFAKTEENQQTVVTLRGNGWSQKRIAAYLGCDEKTLRKNFSRELSAGVDLLEAQALEVIAAKMRQGSLSAAKKILDLVTGGRAAPPPAPEIEDPADLAPKSKGDLLRHGAHNPGKTWGAVLSREH